MTVAWSVSRPACAHEHACSSSRAEEPTACCIPDGKQLKSNE